MTTAEGRGDAEIGKAMEPPPTNFHDAQIFEGLTPYKAYNTQSFGVTGTAC